MRASTYQEEQTITPETIGPDYKYLTFTHPPDLMHNLTNYNTEATWKLKANSIPGFTYSFDNWFVSGVDGMYTDAANVGYIEYQLPSSYNTLTISFGNIHYTSQIRLLINGVVKKIATANQQNVTYAQSYNVGDVLRVEELHAIMSANLYTSVKKIPSTRYTLNFPDNTVCDFLVAGQSKYRYLT